MAQFTKSLLLLFSLLLSVIFITLVLAEANNKEIKRKTLLTSLENKSKSKVEQEQLLKNTFTQQRKQKLKEDNYDLLYFEQVKPEIWTNNVNYSNCWNFLPFNEQILQVKSLSVNSNNNEKVVGLLVLTTKDLYLAIILEANNLFNNKSSNTKWVRLTDRIFGSVSPSFGELTKLRTNNNDSFILMSNNLFIFCKNQNWINLNGWNCPVVNNGFQSLSTINDVVVLDWYNLQLLIGTNNGLYMTYNYLQHLEIIKEVGINPIMAVAYNNITKDIAVSTSDKLFIYSTVHQKKVWYGFDNDGLIDGPFVNSLAFDEKTNILWISNTDTMININFNNYFELTRFGSGVNSIPYNTSKLVFVDNLHKDQGFSSVWFGTTKGAVRYRKDLQNSKEDWSYFYGSRYLPEVFTTLADGTVTDNGYQEIIDISVTHVFNYELTVLITKHGMSILHFPIINLDMKEQYYNDIIFPRHWRNNGLVTQTSLFRFGDLDSWNRWNATTDNDALWSSFFVIYKGFDYYMTNNPNSKKIGWQAYEAIEFLLNVTCVTGYTARSINMNYPLKGKWFKSTCTSGDWYFSSDSSSDTVSGQVFTHVFTYYLLADNYNEKLRVKKNLYNILHYIVKNGFLLYDVDGERTRWGVWAPQFLNSDPSWYGERGVNSLEILSWLLATYSITGEEEFKDAFLYLVEENLYDINIINQKLVKPTEVNYSDDELAFLPYFIYFFSYSQLTAEQQSVKQLFDRILPAMKVSFERAYNYIKKERSPIWNAIYGFYKEKVLHKSDNNDWIYSTLQTLKEWPLSLVDWPYFANNRIDIQMDPYPTRFNTQQTLTLMKYFENTFLRWNSNPYELGLTGSATTEDVPNTWLLSHSMLKYLGKIENLKKIKDL
ncbi:hypothetical protein ABK040_015707 [Willaertia magna]